MLGLGAPGGGLYSPAGVGVAVCCGVAALAAHCVEDVDVDDEGGMGVVADVAVEEGGGKGVVVANLFVISVSLRPANTVLTAGIARDVNIISLLWCLCL